MTDTKQPRKQFRLRRLTSFSLRTASIAIMVLAVWLGLHMNGVRKQRASIEAVQRHGGWVHYDYEVTDYLGFDRNAESSVPVPILQTLGRDHFHSVVVVSLALRTPRQLSDTVAKAHNRGATGEDVFGLLESFPHLEGLWLGEPQLTDYRMQYLCQLTELRTLGSENATEVTDRGMERLSDNLPQLELLSLNNCRFTDESVRVLSRLPKLEDLRLHGNRLPGEGLAHVQSMTQLRRLSLSGEGNQITDSDLIHLKQLTHLEWLRLEDSHVTDDGLRHLVDLQNLEQLWLTGSQVKDASLLRERLPNCKIHY